MTNNRLACPFKIRGDIIGCLLLSNFRRGLLGGFLGIFLGRFLGGLRGFFYLLRYLHLLMLILEILIVLVRE